MPGLALDGPWLADVALAALAVELIVIAALRRAWLREVAIAAAPGLFLLLALRAALAEAAWPVVAGCVALALPAHLLALRRQLLQPKRPG